GCSAVSRSKVSQPFFTGMLRSSNARSSGNPSASSCACCPSSAGMTTQPSDTSTSFKESRTVESSSTTRMRLPGSELRGEGEPADLQTGRGCLERFPERAWAEDFFEYVVVFMKNC